MLALVAVALFVGFCALGVWQVQRRAWKLDLMERVSQRLQAPVQALPPKESWPGLQPADYEYLHVQLQGQWLAGKTVLTQATTVLGQGFWVVTPLQQSDGSVVLVNRGFVPESQRAQWLQPPVRTAEPVTVQGLLRKTEPGGGYLRHNDPAAQKWYSRDVAAIAAAQQISGVAPFFVDAGLPDANLSADAESAPAGNGPWPREGMTTVRFANNHLVYAITWFGLAIMVVGAAVLVARHERHKAQHPARHDPA